MTISKVIITLHGKQAEVDSDQVKMLLKKESLVNRAMILKDDKTIEAKTEIIKVMGKIISLNRRIRKNVRFL